jgi:asparagine synthase (glutamine-hydrolysing)
MNAGFDHWGVEATLERLNGMFAFALWDRERRTLTLARDRMGEKPLYYGAMGGSFLFGSELKALTAHPDFTGVVNRDALTSFLRYNYVPAPHSIWRGISKLPPAHYVEVSDGGRTVGEPVAYWDFSAAAAHGAANPLPDGPELLDELETLLKDSVLRRMEADVALGAFLSGGVDSTLIVALMQAQSARSVKTFTIGFAEQAYDESPFAAAVAGHLGTDHTELRVAPADALALVPDLPRMWDEPFSDSSQIPTHLVSRLARSEVKVALSGDGGDELFGGYNRYVMAPKLMAMSEKLGPRLSSMVAGIARSRAGLSAATGLARLLPASRRPLGLADRLHKVGHAMEAGSVGELYRRLVSHCEDPERLVIGGREPEPASGAPAFADVRQAMMHADTLTYLPDDILVKVDRASMAVSLEARAPYLDHRLVEFAWRMPMDAKIRDGVGKHALRALIDRHVPRRLMERPKMGFGLPISAWLTGALRDWAGDLLDESRLRREGFFDPAPVRALWDEQLRRGGRHQELWDILMFQAWWAEQGGTGAAADEAPVAVNG